MAHPLRSRPKTDALLARLTGLHPKSIDLSLDRILRLLARLGDPHLAVPPAVHVAGTNGKGSVVAYLRAILEAAGQRVHVYTSPHLVRFNERIRLDGRLIEDEPLIELLEECERANRDEPITLFEITTAAAFLAFARAPADVLLLETGLGGRLDATNVVPRPSLTAITAIAYDHMQYLGDTLRAIAGEKAGIMKRGVPCVVGPQPPEVAAVLAARAAAAGAPLFRAGPDWQAEAVDGGLRWRDTRAEVRLPLPVLPGVHQIENAGIAVACARKLDGFPLNDLAVARGLRGAEWPARLQRLLRGPLLALAPPGSEVWLDGGHNPAAGQALAATFAGWRCNLPERPLYLLVGMLNTKDAVGFLAPFAGLAAGMLAVAVPHEANSFSAEETAARASAAGLAARPAAGLVEAMTILRDMTTGRPPPRILICGSLYLAGHILAENG